MKPWERQKKESTQAYEAFCEYRDMGPDRSQAKVAEKLGKSIALMNRWSRKWNWVERAQAWDDELDRKARSEQIKEKKKMIERHTKISMMFQQKIIERMQTLRPEDLTPSDLPKWLDIAIKIERLSRGEATENIDSKVNAEVKTDIFERIKKYEEFFNSEKESNSISNDTGE